MKEYLYFDKIFKTHLIASNQLGDRYTLIGEVSEIVIGSKPTAFEKNNLPLEVRYAFCEAIEMYHNIQAYEMGLIDKTEFINHTIAIKDKYK